MCYNPIIVPNKRLTSKYNQFNLLTDKTTLKVPCGHCPDCLRRKQKELEIRMHYEYKDCIKNGGVVLFNTFTYDVKHVPLFHGVLCFSQKHYQGFMKRLRTKLSRQLKLPYNQIKLRVVWSSEYGGKTHRPHYHAVFFLHNFISPIDFANIINDSWIYGFTDNRNAYKLVVNSHAALNYATKYISKPQSFLDCINDQKYQDSFIPWLMPIYKGIFGKPFKKGTKITYKLLSTIIRKFDDPQKLELKNLIPFHTHSHGLGDSILNYVSTEDLLHDNIISSDISNGVPQCTPSYYIRKFFQEKVPLRIADINDNFIPLNNVLVTTFYKDTNDSIIHKINRLDYSLTSFDSKIKNLFTLADSINNINHDFTKHMSQYGFQYNNTLECYHHIEKLLANRTLSSLGMYSLFYKDRYYKSKPILDKNYILTETYDNFLEEGFLPFEKSPQYNDLEIFDDFDKILSIFEHIQTYISHNRTLVDNLKRNQEEELSSAYHSIISRYFEI